MFQLEKTPLIELKIEAIKAIVKMTTLFANNVDFYYDLL